MAQITAKHCANHPSAPTEDTDATIRDSRCFVCAADTKREGCFCSHRHCPRKWMTVILPLIISVSQKDGLFRMEEKTFCRTEHSGTENLRLLLRHKICDSQIPFRYVFYHTTLGKKIRTAKTHV